MCTKSFICFIVIIALLFAGCKKENKYSPQEVFEELKQIEGNWKNSPYGTNFEDWLMQEDGALVGTGYNIFESDTVLTELYTIELADDSLVYQVNVISDIGVNTYDYYLDNITGNQVTLINPERDFPRTLTYEFEEDQFIVYRRGKIMDNEEEIIETYVRANQ